MLHADPDPEASPQASPDHTLTPMESFFDNLFNEHMVLPQTPEEAASIDSLDEPNAAREDHPSGQG